MVATAQVKAALATLRAQQAKPGGILGGIWKDAQSEWESFDDLEGGVEAVIFNNEVPASPVSDTVLSDSGVVVVSRTDVTISAETSEPAVSDVTLISSGAGPTGASGDVLLISSGNASSGASGYVLL